MPEFVRVYDKTLNRKYSVPAASVDPDLEQLDDDPYDHNGDPAAPEFDVTKTGRVAASATTPKES